MISFEEFQIISFKVAKIIEVNDHPDADRLYVLKVDLGEEIRQIVAGVKKDYKKEELLNKQIVVVDNLESISIRGVESNGMLLAAHDENSISVVTIDREVEPGSRVR